MTVYEGAQAVAIQAQIDSLPFTAIRLTPTYVELQAAAITGDRAITWHEIRSLYYNDDLDYNQVEALCEMIWGTTHRDFGDLPITVCPETKTLCQEAGVRQDITNDLAACFYAALLDLYSYGGLSWFDDISPLLPTSRGTNPERIRSLIERHSQILIARC